MNPVHQVCLECEPRSTTPNLSQVAPVPSPSLVSPFPGLTTFSIFHPLFRPPSPLQFHSNFPLPLLSHDPPPLSVFLASYFPSSTPAPFAFPSSLCRSHSSSFFSLLFFLDSFFPCKQGYIWIFWGLHGWEERWEGEGKKNGARRERRLYWTREERADRGWNLVVESCSPLLPPLERSEDRKDWCLVSCPRASALPIEGRDEDEKSGRKARCLAGIRNGLRNRME